MYHNEGASAFYYLTIQMNIFCAGENNDDEKWNARERQPPVSDLLPAASAGFKRPTFNWTHSQPFTACVLISQIFCKTIQNLINGIILTQQEQTEDY